jgi:ribosomal protein L7Ae-like RNA K-turn-binding protein
LEPIGKYRQKCKAHKKSKKPATEAMDKPEIYDRVHVGINQVTRYLEKYIESQSQKEALIYICKREIKPLKLCEHLLYMAAVAKVKLIPMPADSELQLGKALNLHKASVILVEVRQVLVK